ncbi:MAG: 2-C-methyl-D-erythritol 4-phosphate cytidylyltransferase [Bacillales bacterium]|nr:2-C-methyl-D-erythritol 4-phosphate cytidylyltransferase [Bacillales bacterium]
MKYDCILLAAGEGQRAALGYNKALYKINGQKELVLYSLEYFLKDPFCSKIILVISETDKNYFKNLIQDPKVEFTIGGSMRGDSVAAGLLKATAEYVIIHDSARPLVYKEDVYNVLNAAEETGGATLAAKVYNTTCHIENGYVSEYFSRHTLASLITPQCFNKKKLEAAYQKAAEAGENFTDDSGIFKACGNAVKLVFTDNISIKATTPYDIRLLEDLLYAHR